MKTYKYELTALEYFCIPAMDTVYYKKVYQWVTSLNKCRVVYRLKQI
jgi:hypothetical protein